MSVHRQIGIALMTAMIATLIWGAFVIPPVAVRILVASVLVLVWRDTLKNLGVW